MNEVRDRHEQATKAQAMQPTARHVQSAEEHEQELSPPQRPLVSVQLRSPVNVGSQGVKAIGSQDANSLVNKGLTMSVDYEKRIVTFRWDTGSGVHHGETPFENVIGINRGTEMP